MKEQIALCVSGMGPKETLASPQVVLMFVGQSATVGT